MAMQSPVAIPREILDFHLALNRLHKQFVRNLPPLKISPTQKESHLQHKAPLLNFVEFRPQKEEIFRVFHEVCRLIREYRPHIEDSLCRIEKELAGEKDWGTDLVSLFEKYVWQDQVYLAGYVQQRHLDGELLYLVLFYTAKPIVSNYARRLKDELAIDLWYENFCPVCGWKPALATLGTDKKRVLHCSLCDTAWPFKSLECPHCLNEDHRSLKYFTVAGDETYQVHVCEKCKGYIKTVSEEKLAVKEDPFIIDVKTLYLDILALNQGYQKNASGPSASPVKRQ